MTIAGKIFQIKRLSMCFIEEDANMTSLYQNLKAMEKDIDFQFQLLTSLTQNADFGVLIK